MKKLYRVELEYVLYVMAEDSYDAESEARCFVFDEQPANCYPAEVSPTDRIDSGWLGAGAYGDDTGRTVDQIMDEMKGSK